ncbi:MAG: hypothetical protein JMDDDDMK_03307 [Acidobacteria bacterium]|nr:hypothetical protein [Acidobacteriota bacterium]
MLQELLHQLLGIASDQLTWQDYAVAAAGAVIFLTLRPVFRSLFFAIKRSARIAKTASLIVCLALAASWAGLALNVFGYLMTLTIILPVLALILIGATTYVFVAREE